VTTREPDGDDWVYVLVPCMQMLLQMGVLKKDEPIAVTILVNA